MASCVTNRGKLRALEVALRGTNVPSQFEARLVTATTVGAVSIQDVDTVADLNELPTGNGYDRTTPVVIERSAVGWDTVNEDDAGDLAYLRAKDVSYTAAGGAIPASGDGAGYLAICTPGASDATREVWALLDIGGPVTIPSGQTRIFQDSEIRGTE
jgi:hypothetical protein